MGCDIKEGGVYLLGSNKTSGKRELLGRAGDKVKVIAIHDDVCIVERGVIRFSVRNELLIETKEQ